MLVKDFLDYNSGFCNSCTVEVDHIVIAIGCPYIVGEHDMIKLIDQGREEGRRQHTNLQGQSHGLRQVLPPSLVLVLLLPIQKNFG